MGYRTFWDEDVTVARAYRKAQEIKNEMLNSELWLQGMYIYEAFLDASPVLNAFAKKGTKPRSYRSQPYDLATHKNKNVSEDPYDRPRAIMEGYMKRFNKHFNNNRPAQTVTSNSTTEGGEEFVRNSGA